MARLSTSARDLLVSAREMLRFQSELGLHTIPVLPDALRARLRAAPTRTEAPTAPLDRVRAAVDDCRRCRLSAGRTHIVFGVGNPRARLMLIGEAPGKDEDLQGEPFVGAAGQLLDKMILAMGLARQDVYITNVVKCRPPRNRDPEPDEVRACESFLRDQIDAIGPQVIVTLGRCAAQVLFADATPIARLRGQWREYRGIAVMPTYHPAYLLRYPQEKKLVWQDLQAVMARLGLTLRSKST